MGEYENEIEVKMMQGMVEQEKKHSVTNVIKEIQDKSKTDEFQKIIQQTLRETNGKPKKDKWFNIFKRK